MADTRSEGAFYSGAASYHSNPRLKGFQDRFAQVAEMIGVEAIWDTYLDAARRDYDKRRRENEDHTRTRTIRSSKFGAPGKE